MNKTLYIASCIKVCRSGIIDEKKFNDKLTTVAENSIGNACTGANKNSGAGNGEAVCYLLYMIKN